MWYLTIRFLLVVLVNGGQLSFVVIHMLIPQVTFKPIHCA